jgi:hypothetical protein
MFQRERRGLVVVVVVVVVNSVGHSPSWEAAPGLTPKIVEGDYALRTMDQLLSISQKHPCALQNQTRILRPRDP